MNKISNADKQARFRKKEQLKRHANNILREWQVKFSLYKSKSITPEDVQYALDKAIDLPSGWTEQDYECAVQALAQLRVDLCFTSDQLVNDVEAGWNPQDFITSSEPAKLMSDHKGRLEDTRALAAHLISALKLSNCNDANQAAALMEALRFVGRSMIGNRDVPHSQATTVCLASIAPHYKRPDWFPEELTEIIHQPIERGSLYQKAASLVSSKEH
jgi:hypothetical protein